MFSLEEQAKILAAGRSNNMLDTRKLEAEFPELLPIKESLLKFVFLPQLRNVEGSSEKAKGKEKEKKRGGKCAVPVENFE
jgi:hypothetical protein